MTKEIFIELKDRAKRIRRLTLKAIFDAKSGHPGGSLSSVDILTYLYSKVLTSGDKFILSKGHACPAWYATLAETGKLPEEELSTLRKLGSRLQGHPSPQLPQVVTPTGSLGQGFSVGVGMALGYKHIKTVNKVYVLLGDGELQEGLVWESAMIASSYALGSLCVLIDYNGLSSDDRVLGLEPLHDKLTAFGFYVLHINGHDFGELGYAMDIFKQGCIKPLAVICRTTKGKGVSFMENKPEWHGSLVLSEEELNVALAELMGELNR